MGNRDAALKQYYRSIRGELPCSWGQRSRILRQIRENVDNYLEENPDADFAAIEAHFGNAQAIASSYIDAQDAPELLRKMRIKKRVIAIVAGAMAVVLLIWGVAVVWAMVEAKGSYDGGAQEVIEIIE